MSENFEKMTVLELRRVAKEMGVTLGAGISKQGIVDKLNEAAQGQSPAADTAHALPNPSRPIRSAAIITDDESEDEDIPVLTPSPIASRPVQQPVQQTNAPASSLSTISAKAPAFTMEGSRAWHNPRPQQNSPYQRAPQAWGAPRPAAAAQNPGYNRPGVPPRSDQRPQNRVPAYPNRFGPDNAQNEAPEYRTSSYAPTQDYQARSEYAPRDYPQRNEYQPRNDYQPRSDMNPPRETAYAQPAPAPYYQKEAAPVMPDLIATGECGDGEGVLEIHPDGYGFLHTSHYRPGKNDVYIANAQIHRFNLVAGDYIVGKTRPRREGDKYTAMLYITEINGRIPEENITRPSFDDYTAIFPKRRIHLSDHLNDPVLRLIDLLSPIGFGQRALIKAGPRTGKTDLFKKLAAAIHENHPKTHLMLLLIDERPEDVTAMREEIKGEVIDSTFDEPAESHMKTCELTLERAKRLVEMKKDVVILTDSITRMARAYHALAPQTARSMEGGLAAGAMNKPKKFFGAARNTKEGGTLTIIATATQDTGSILDEAILDEIRVTPNMEMTLERRPTEKRITPVPLLSSMRTKHDELLLTEKERALAEKLRAMDDLSQILPLLEKTESNEALADLLADMHP